MIVQIHSTEPGGRIGGLLATIEREPKIRKRDNRECIQFDGDWFPVTTIFGGFMITMPASRFEGSKAKARQ